VKPPEPTDDAAQAWRLQLPDELRQEKSLAQVKDIASLARGYVEAQKSFGSRVPFPTDKDTPEERERKMQDIWTKMGRPAKPDQYGIEAPSGLPEGMPWDADGQREFLGHAHQLGLTKDQALGVLDWYADRTSQVYMATRQESNVIEEKLREEWGRAYDRNIAFAQRAVEALGGPGLKEELNKTGMGNNPKLIKTFAKAGKLLAEAQMISGRVEGVLDPQEAIRQINAIQTNREHAYHQRNNPGHEEAVKHMKALFELGYPTTI
jgi:hypothetical protein